MVSREVTCVRAKRGFSRNQGKIIHRIFLCIMYNTYYDCIMYCIMY